jgi:DNA-binding FadR family transcriptional regulator
MSLDKSPSAIEHRLTQDILRGLYPVGARLPTVRELAETHGVNPATIQRAVSRLETRGLVTARQGSGLRVNDPTEVGDLSLMPFWIEASLDQPDEASALLADLLEVRRVIAARLMVRHRERILAQASTLKAAAQTLLEVAEGGLEALRDADLAFSRALLKATGNQVALSVLNTMARVLEEVPEVAQAMYAQPETNNASMLAVLQLLVENERGAAKAIEERIEDVDAHTLSRFEALLVERARRASGQANVQAGARA